MVISEGDIPVTRKFVGRTPLYISWTRRKSPDIMPPKTAVICRLSSAPAIATRFDPYLSLVQDDTGTCSVSQFGPN